MISGLEIFIFLKYNNIWWKRLGCKDPNLFLYVFGYTLMGQNSENKLQILIRLMCKTKCFTS